MLYDDEQGDRMDNDHKGMQERIAIPDELRQIEREHDARQRHTHVISGREGGKSRSVRQAKPMLQVVRPVQPTSRTMPQRVAFGRSAAGQVIWRDVPSWFQQREPSTEQAIVHATKTTPWAKKRRARARNKAARASRKANR